MVKKLLFATFVACLLSGAQAFGQGSCNSMWAANPTNCPNFTFFDFSVGSNGAPIVSWGWDFGDGNSSTLQNPSNTYAANGNYFVCLTIVDSTGCTDTRCDTVAVTCIGGSSCSANFTFTMGSCPTIGFTDLSSATPGQVTMWNWNFGDGNSSSSQNPTHTYSSNGSYQVCLGITTSDTCISTFCDTVHVTCVGGGPSCNSSYTTNVTNCPDIIFMSNSTSSPGTINSYYWTFGDGGTDTASAVQHLYSNNGTYTVCLTITTTDTCQHTWCDTLVINCIGTPCTASMSMDSSNCPMIGFSGSGNSQTSSPTAGWAWDFGDGSTSSMQNPTHTYGANGSYAVCLIVTFQDLCSAQVCDTLDINCITGGQCMAAFSVDSSNCPIMGFTDQSQGGGGALSSWNWDFGDGGTSTQQNPSHTYTANGTYNVCLSIVTTDSCTDVRCNQIMVNCIGSSGQCDAGFIWNETSPLNVSFTDGSTSSTGTITNWLWDFGDGNGSITQNPTHTYASAGPWIVCLSITTNDSCVGTICDTLNLTVGIDDGILPIPVDVYPVPSTGSVSIVSELQKPGLVTFTVTDATGRTITKWSTRSNGVTLKETWEAPGKQSGIYFLEVATEGRRTVKKILITQ